MKIALLLCLIASVGYGFGAVLQAIGARRATCKGAEGLRMMVTQPIFLLGLLCDFTSWVTSRFALHELPLFAVQSILAGSLAITVLLAGIILHAELRRTDRIAIVTALIGLAVIAISAGEDTAGHISRLVRIFIVLGIPAVIVLAVLAIRLNKAVVLAVLAGASFTGSALSARLVRIHHHSILSIVGEPRLWAMVAYAGVALVLHAMALQRGNVGPITAAMWSTEVLVASIVSATFLGDHLRPGWEVPAILGIALTLASTIALASSPAQEMDHSVVPVPSGHPTPVATAELPPQPSDESQLINDPSDHR
ncbi:MAG TPA: hypothetical protein VGM78_12280 [Ilumatobacteraceae bacterium]